MSNYDMPASGYGNPVQDTDTGYGEPVIDEDEDEETGNVGYGNPAVIRNAPGGYIADSYGDSASALSDNTTSYDLDSDGPDFNAYNFTNAQEGDSIPELMYDTPTITVSKNIISYNIFSTT